MRPFFIFILQITRDGARACLADFGVAIHANEKKLPYMRRYTEFDLRHDFHDFANILRTLLPNGVQHIFALSKECDGLAQNWERILHELDVLDGNKCGDGLSALEIAQRLFDSADTTQRTVFIMSKIHGVERCKRFLQFMVMRGDVENAVLLIEEIKHLPDACRLFTHLLPYALRNGHTQMAQYLHNLLSESNLKIFYERDDVFANAIFAGHANIIETILSHPCISKFNLDYAYMLLHSAAYGFVDLVRLFAAHCDAHTVYNGKSSLHVAVEFGHTELALYLLNTGADVTTLSGDINVPTALTLAAYHNRPKLIKPLYDRGHVSQQNATCALFWAVRLGNEACVHALLFECKMDPNIQCHEDGLFPIHVACGCVIENILKILISAGANVNQRDMTKLRDMPLHYIAYNPIAYVNHAKILLDNGADINAHNQENDTPLFSLIINHKLESIELLQQFIAAGADTLGNSSLLLALFARQQRIPNSVYANKVLFCNGKK